MYRSLIVVDDVLDNVDELRRAALGLDYPEPDAPTYFPGRNSSQALRVQLLEEAAMRLTGERLYPATDSHAKCRITLADDVGEGDVHVDECHWSGIYYLSKPEDCQGGTDFFRHIPTDSEHAPYHPDHLKAWGYESYADFVEKVSRPHSKDPSQWERVMRVPMKYNRLILFRPWLWHTAGPAFGDRLDNGRLIYLLFFGSDGPL